MPAKLAINETVGETIPPDTPHAVSVSLPTWRSNVGYEEGEKWVLDKMKCGYPRFFIHPSIRSLAQHIVDRHGQADEMAMLFPSYKCAARCEAFLKQQHPGRDISSVRILEFVPQQDRTSSPSAKTKQLQPHVTALMFSADLWLAAKAFWQHTGEGISSRRAEFVQRAFDEGAMVERKVNGGSPNRMAKGPRRYQRSLSHDQHMSNGHGAIASSNIGDSVQGVQDSVLFVEERFGRNLNLTFAAQAKLAIRRRIAGTLTADKDLPESLQEPTDLCRTRSRDVPSFSPDDVYLFSCGMNAIYTAHCCLRQIHGDRKSIMFGFPYVDTLKVLEKFGPGALHYGTGLSDELDDLEKRLESGERYLCLFCEFPGNPLLRTPDLKRIRALADKYDFAVVVDETLGNFLNVHVLPYVDVAVSSLTKIFSGDSNVMGGSMIVNPHSKHYDRLKDILAVDYEDNLFEEDAVYLERNSRDFVSRIQRVNDNAEAIADVLLTNPRIKDVNYPKYSPTKHFYDACRLPDGGYGGLLSCTFHEMKDAQVFYDNLDIQKGPSLGTNFTLGSPFIILAHYNELDWCASLGVDASLVRFSVGLEETEALKQIFRVALAAMDET